VYSNKENVNILTALLVGHGVKYAVVCPGSRNAPIVHNLVVCPDITCYSVTDERSAGFYALGLAQATDAPVAVCVTSGTALLNLLPAVAEAYYQHVPMVIISADRPPQWIDQLDGQTLPQAEALGRFVRKAVTLPEPHDEETHWFCNRLVNEALMTAYGRERQPVHINVPMTEPLYDFSVETLPEERLVARTYGKLSYEELMTEKSPLYDFWKSERPLIVIGQNAYFNPDDVPEVMRNAVVLRESLGSADGGNLFDEVLARSADDEALKPDFILYNEGTLVSKRLKQFLRRTASSEIRCWEVSQDGELHDVFKQADGVMEGNIDEVLMLFEDVLTNPTFFEENYEMTLGPKVDTSAFVSLWQQLLDEQSERCENYEPAYSQMAAVKMLEQRMSQLALLPTTHYANSSSVRLANIYSRGYVYCNRGVNGIEGSLSTAAGFSLVKEGLVFCVLGDLSFFYDANALWQQDLRQNLRILLLNNGCGGIFEKFSGLKDSPARERFVMAHHDTSAEGICQSYCVAYRKAENLEELKAGIDWLVNEESVAEGISAKRPRLLEVLTDSENDARVLEEYYNLF